MGAGGKVPLTSMSRQCLHRNLRAGPQVRFPFSGPPKGSVQGGKTREGESELVISRTIQCSVTESGKAQKP